MSNQPPSFGGGVIGGPAGQITTDPQQQAARQLYDAFGKIVPPQNDPAFQPPSDPLVDISAVRNRARVIHREIPNVVTRIGWSPDQIRAAIEDLVIGLFDRPSQLQDAIAGDSRVQSAMRSRSGGLLGKPLRFTIPKRYRDEPLAKKCQRAWERHWPQMHAEPALLDLLETGSSVGQAYDQILWDTSKTVWKPYLLPFYGRYSYYHWIFRCHVAITQDGQLPITPGDGHWVLHAPYGQYRGWMRGALRAVAMWVLARDYALRDWAAYSEKHGFPTIIADTPFGADPDDVNAFGAQLVGLGQNSIVQVPGSVDVTKYGKYDLRYLEPNDPTWQAFKALIDQCNDEITLALLGQNLTTQVKEGSFAAARVHADVRQAILEADARALSKTLYTQVLRPFAALNFGNANLAPQVAWDISPPEDQKERAGALMSFGQALNFLRLAGYKVENVERLAKEYGIRKLEVTHVDPMQVEARVAAKTGDANPEEDSKPSDEDKSNEEIEQRLDDMGIVALRSSRRVKRSEDRLKEVFKAIATLSRKAAQQSAQLSLLT